MKFTAKAFPVDAVRILNRDQAADWPGAEIGDWLVTTQDGPRTITCWKANAFAVCFEPGDDEARRAIEPTEAERRATEESDLDRRRRGEVA